MLKLERESEIERAAASTGWATPARMPGAGFEPALSHALISFDFSFRLRSMRTPRALTGGSYSVVGWLIGQAKRYRKTASPTFRSVTSAPLASSRANFTASCSRSTRPSSSLTR